MKCERCPSGDEARYRAYSDIIDMKVCAACASDGRRLGVTVEVLDPLRSSVPNHSGNGGAYAVWWPEVTGF
jgi:hypothetical protein